ncbi:MAG: hypothetical protein U0704_15340 [Candidatus Eisenbacteria bacterium]
MTSVHARAATPEGVELAPFDPESRVALEWKQPRAWTAEHELTDGTHVFARIATTGWLAHRMSIAFAHASWDVRVTAFGDLVVDGSEGRDAEPYLRHRRGFWSGKMQRRGLPTLRTRSGGFWRPWWELRDPEDQPLLHLDTHHGFLRTSADLVVLDAARALPDLPALIGLSMLVLLAAQRQRAHAAAHS